MSKAILKKGLGLRVAALAAVVAAVALFGAVFTDSAEAVGPGDHHDLTAVGSTSFTTSPADLNDGVVRFEIDPNSSARGSFDYNGGQSLTCQNNTKCDREDATDTNVVVRVNVDDDSPNGFIIIDITDLNGDAATRESRQLISVNTDDRVAAIDATTATPSPAISATAPTP